MISTKMGYDPIFQKKGDRTRLLVVIMMKTIICVSKGVYHKLALVNQILHFTLFHHHLPS